MFEKHESIYIVFKVANQNGLLIIKIKLFCFEKFINT